MRTHTHTHMHAHEGRLILPRVYSGVSALNVNRKSRIETSTYLLDDTCTLVLYKVTRMVVAT